MAAQLTFARPVQVPAWHLYVGQYFLYPLPWVLDPKRFLGRAAFHQIARLESLLRRGGIGYCAQNLVAVARASSRASARNTAIAKSHGAVRTLS